MVPTQKIYDQIPAELRAEHTAFFDKLTEIKSYSMSLKENTSPLVREIRHDIINNLSIIALNLSLIDKTPDFYGQIHPELIELYTHTCTMHDLLKTIANDPSHSATNLCLADIISNVVAGESLEPSAIMLEGTPDSQIKIALIISEIIANARKNSQTSDNKDQLFTISIHSDVGNMVMSVQNPGQLTDGFTLPQPATAPEYYTPASEANGQNGLQFIVNTLTMLSTRHSSPNAPANFTLQHADGIVIAELHIPAAWIKLNPKEV